MNVGLVNIHHQGATTIVSRHLPVSQPCSSETPRICSIDLLASLSPKVIILISQIVAIHPWASALVWQFSWQFSERPSILQTSRLNHESPTSKSSTISIMLH